MRTGPWVAVLTVACVSENELRYTATLQSETNGVALSDDGLDSFAGMVGTTCTIDTNWGCPTADADVEVTPDERVVDHWRGTTLAVSAEGLHTLALDGWLRDDDLAVAAVRTAALSDAGHSVLSGDAKACTWQAPDGASIPVGAALCEDGVRYAVDRVDGALFAVTAAGAVLVDAAGERLLAGGVDLASYDSRLGLLYVATRGEDAVAALDRQGEQVWKASAGGAVTGLAARGDRGEVLVRVRREDGLAGLERRDGETGELLGRSTLPGHDGEIVVSDNGQTVAVVRETEVNFFHLETDGEKPTIDETPPECITPTIGGGGVNLGD